MKKLFLTTSLLLVLLNAFAQQELTIYNMDAIGQSTQYNPSLMPLNRMYIGIPALSSTSLLFSNSGFTWRDIHKRRSDDSITLDIENAISKLAAKNFINLSVRVNLLEAGVKVKKNYFTLNVSEKANLNFTFPKEFFELAMEGNGAFIGKEVNLKRLSFDATHYREYAIGWARELNSKVTTGVRVKYLYGMENVSSGKSELSFYTAPDDYTLVLKSDYVINTSMASNSDDGSSNYMFGFKNTGWAGDFSITYNYTDRLKLNASILDIGYINWTSNTKNYTALNGGYTFNGINLNEFINDSSSFDHVADSLEDAFKPQENNDSYKTTLPAHIYLNASYQLGQRMTATGLIHAQTYSGTVQPSFTLGLNRRVTNHLSASLNYSMINHHLNNVGVGLAANAGAFQFYMLTDNIIGTIDPLGNHTTHIHFGFNLIFGRPKIKKLTTDYGVQNKSLPVIDAGKVPDDTNTKED